MPSIADDLQRSAVDFSARLLRWLRTIPRDPITDTVVRQLARAGTSVAANYRATRRARSRAEFVARLAIVAEEADESVHWLGQLRAAAVVAGAESEWLLDEATELRAIFSRSLVTARRNYAAEQAATKRRRP